MPLLAAATVLSAFLLFLIQPLAGKQLLPLFGGSGAVWSACLLFFQFALLAGYLYAHALTRWFRPRQQAVVHCASLLVCLAVPRFEFTTGAGSAHVLTTLAAGVGLPYLVLSTTSPLLQHWHSLLQPGGRPYRLSAWSNGACAAALLSFPLLWEPRFALSRMNLGWNVAFGVEAALLLAAAWMLFQANPAAAPRPMISGTPWRMRLKWIGWPALGSAFLMGASTHLCQGVAPAPLLWVVPLLVYLLTFVVVFSREHYQAISAVSLALAGLLTMAGAMLYLDLQALLFWKVALYTAGLFTVCLFAHGELAALRPEPERLTSYWTHVAAGGAVGSLVLGFATPAFLAGYFELPLLMAGTAALCLYRLRRLSLMARQAAVVAAVLAATPALAFVNTHYSGLVEAGRNFYGSLRIVDQGPLRKMLHGLVVHGSEFRSGPLAGEPTAYYGPMSGAGLTLSRPGPARRVGLIGLGAGTLAWYGREGDSFRFYELNPLVIEVAQRDFGYLRRSKARIEIVEGDARLRLAAEPDHSFDVLIVDAFSGDAIPVHLLTREAMAIYLERLRPGGTIALHISNQYLNLEPVVRALAADAHCSSVRIASQPDAGRAQLGAVWMMVRRDEAAGPTRLPVWTDDWNSVLPVLK